MKWIFSALCYQPAKQFASHLMFPHRQNTERTHDAWGGPAATLVQDQPVVGRPHQGPIFWSCPPPGSAPGRTPALPTLGRTLITSPKGKPFVWKEMVQKEAAATLKIGPGPAPGPRCPWLRARRPSRGQELLLHLAPGELPRVSFL